MLRWFFSGARLPFHFYRGVEITFRLQVVAHVAAAFVQQVVIDGVLLVGRHKLLQFPVADLRALSSNRHRRSLFRFEYIVKTVGIGMVVAVNERDLGFQMIVLLILLA